MNKTMVAVVLLLTLTVPALCGEDKALFEKKGDKERIYKVPIEQLWAAAIKTAAEENVIEHQDKENTVFSYKSGKSAASWGFRVSVSLTKLEDGRTRIKLVTQKIGIQLAAWGAGGRTAEKFFKALDKYLKSSQPD